MSPVDYSGGNYGRPTYVPRDLGPYLHAVADGRIKPQAADIAAIKPQGLTPDQAGFERDVMEAAQRLHDRIAGSVPSSGRGVTARQMSDLASSTLRDLEGRWARDARAKSRGTYDSDDEVRRLTALVPRR